MTTFVTNTLRSRRALSIGWTGALAPTPQAPAAPPVSAWFTPVTHRRRETERRLIKLEPLHWPYIAPSPIAFFEAPKVIRVEFKRKLQTLAPQVELPPPVAPPTAQGFPAWATRPLPPTFQDRHLLRVPEHSVYPETPKPEPNLCARIPTGFHKRRDTERRLQRVELNRYPGAPQPEQPFVAATLVKARRRKRRQGLFLAGGGNVEARVQPQFPSFAGVKAKLRKSTKRSLLRVPALPSAPATPVAPTPQPLPAWREVKANRVSFERKLQRLELNEYPESPALEPSVDRALDQPFAVRRIRQRGLKKVQPLAFYAATPPPAAQPESAWRQPKAFRIERRRKLQKAAPQITYPTTPVVPLNWPSQVSTGFHRRKSTEYWLLEAWFEVGIVEAAAEDVEPTRPKFYRRYRGYDAKVPKHEKRVRRR